LTANLFNRVKELPSYMETGLDEKDFVRQFLLEGKLWGEFPFAQDILHEVLKELPIDGVLRTPIEAGLSATVSVYDSLDGNGNRLYHTSLGRLARKTLNGLFSQNFPPALPGARRLPEEASFRQDIIFDVWPMPMYKYLAMQDGAGESCADLDQTLAVNDLASSTLMGFFQTIGYKLPLHNYESYFTVTGGGSHRPFSTQVYMENTPLMLDSEVSRYIHRDGGWQTGASYDIKATPEEVNRAVNSNVLSQGGLQGLSFMEFLQKNSKNPAWITTEIVRTMALFAKAITAGLGKQVGVAIHRRVLEALRDRFQGDIPEYWNSLVHAQSITMSSFHVSTGNLYSLSPEDLLGEDPSLRVNLEDYFGPNPINQEESPTEVVEEQGLAEEQELVEVLERGPQEEEIQESLDQALTMGEALDQQ